MGYEPFNSTLKDKLHKAGVYSREEIITALGLYCEDHEARCYRCRETFTGIGEVCAGSDNTPQLKRNWPKLLKEGPGHQAAQELKGLGYLPKHSEQKFYSTVFNSPELLGRLKKMHSRKVRPSVIDKMVDEMYLCRRLHGKQSRKAR
jgi:hypothetical protein